MTIFDISRPLRNGLAPWPGDKAFQFGLTWKIADGATVNVGAVEMGVHNGSHADAPFHFQSDGITIERMPLDIYFGDAVVIDLSAKFADGGQDQITVADLLPSETALTSTRRLLLKTNVWKDSAVFPDWIPVVAADVPGWLQQRKVRLIGLDLPSVDPIEAKELVNHHAFADAGIAIVESLDLSEIEAGSYHLSALPLRIDDGDAAPVRAILWRD